METTKVKSNLSLEGGDPIFWQYSVSVQLFFSIGYNKNMYWAPNQHINMICEGSCDTRVIAAEDLAFTGIHICPF